MPQRFCNVENERVDDANWGYVGRTLVHVLRQPTTDPRSDGEGHGLVDGQPVVIPPGSLSKDPPKRRDPPDLPIDALPK